MKKVAVVVSTPMVAKFFLMNHLKQLSKIYNVTLYANLSYGVEYIKDLPKDISIINVNISRDINILSDLKALFNLTGQFYKNKYDLVYSVSPKAGLLSMLAAYVSGVKNRLHTFTGQVWLTSRGFKRNLLIFFDKVISKTASLILVDSNSQKKYLLDNNIIPNERSMVLGNGSISGVDLERFYPDPDVRNEIRKKLNLPDTVIMFLYVGRLKRDKGVLDLAKAFINVNALVSNSFLVFAGPDEENMQEEIEIITFDVSNCVRFIPYTDSPEYFMKAADVFCLPSYREGFGSTVIEAAACGVPTVASNIYGLSEAVIDGVTGILVPPGNIDELSNALIRISNESNLRKDLSDNARKRAVSDFNQDLVTGELVELYSRLLN